MPVYVVEPEHFIEFGQDIHRITEIARFRQERKTVIAVGTKELIYGIIAVQDEIRPESKEAIRRLTAMGITVVMLNGDNENTAKAVTISVFLTFGQVFTQKIRYTQFGISKEYMNLLRWLEME